MFDIGFWELVLVFVVALVVVGPERLPELARTLGLWIGKARHMVSEVKGEVERELRMDELKRSIHQQETFEEMRRLADRVKSINSEVSEVHTGITKSLQQPNDIKTAQPSDQSLPSADSSSNPLAK